MTEDIIHEIDRECDQILDVQRLLEAVRGSRAAQVLFELRPWLLRSGDPTVDEAASSFTAPPSDEFTRPNVIQP
jgi:hypothetical protein